LRERKAASRFNPCRCFLLYWICLKVFQRLS